MKAEVMVRNQFSFYLAVLALAICAGSSRASSMIGVLEDSPGSSGNLAYLSMPGGAGANGISFDVAVGESAAFDPDGPFALSSPDDRNIGESPDQQDFAYFEEPSCEPPKVPEPPAAALAGIGVALLALAVIPRQGKR